MSTTESVTLKPVQYLGKSPQTARHAINPEVQGCIEWLWSNRFVIPHSANQHDYAPSVGCMFKVLKPLETCGNENNPIMDVGVWECTRHWESTSGLWCSFRSPKSGGVRHRVGYLPEGIHVIMAWKENIRLVRIAV